MSTDKCLGDRSRLPKPPDKQAVAKKVASPDSKTTAPLGFLDLPSEIRNQIYVCLFPRNARLETSQTSCNRHHKYIVGRDHNADVHFHHTISGPTKNHTRYVLGILGTCKKIREEATGIFVHNLAGTLTINEGSNKFRRIPPLIRRVIDTITLSPSRSLCRVTWHTTHLFPSFERLIVGSFVLKMHTIPEALRDLQTSLDRATFTERVKTHFDNLGSQNPMGDERVSSRAYRFVNYKTPPNVRLLSRACFVAIILQVYVVDPDTPSKGQEARGGFLLEFDYNQGLVVSIEEKQFYRLPMSSEPDPDLREWWNPGLWRYVDLRADENFILGG